MKDEDRKKDLSMTAESRFLLVSNILLAGAFIGGFYFTVAKNIEGQTVRNNVRDVFPDLTIPTLSAPVRSQLCRNLTGFTDALRPPDDTSVIQNNEALMTKGTQALKKGLTYGGLLLFLIYITRNKRESFSFARIGKDTLWSMSAIAAAELTFFYLVVGNATYIDRQDVINAYMDRPIQSSEKIQALF